MARKVSVKSGPSKFGQLVYIGHHVLQSDEPADVGGDDSGPDPHELLMASLGACVNMTTRMYAERKQWPLQEVEVALSDSRVPGEVGDESDAHIGMVDRLELQVSLAGNLSEEQRSALLEVTNRCPIHRMLVSQIQIDTKLLAHGS